MFAYLWLLVENPSQLHVGICRTVRVHPTEKVEMCVKRPIHTNQICTAFVNWNGPLLKDPCDLSGTLMRENSMATWIH